MRLQHPLVILILVLTQEAQAHFGRIHGGHEAAAHSRPYMVLLSRGKEAAKKYCGGFLLREDFVMTAAHCQGQSYRVILGLHNFHHKSGLQYLMVEESFVHPNYSREGFKNDIMLLKLSSRAEFNTEVGSIVLADQGDGSLPQSCSIAGWGRTRQDSNHMSLVLMEANVTLANLETCETEHSFCSEDKEGPGEGDSGGPLVCGNREAYGVMSSGWQPDSGGPVIQHYAKIPDYRSWIDSILNQSKHNEKYPAKGFDARRGLRKKSI